MDVILTFKETSFDIWILGIKNILYTNISFFFLSTGKLKPIDWIEVLIFVDIKWYKQMFTYGSFLDAITSVIPYKLFPIYVTAVF